VGNDRLRNAMIAARIDIDSLAQLTNVDPKTVQRWLNGRIPHPRHRWKIAELLREREEVLWPVDRCMIANEHTTEIIAAYAHRNDVPPNAWLQLFMRAKKQLDLLGHAMLFIPEQNSGVLNLFQEKAATGCKIRVAIADPNCTAIQMRDEEERLGGTLAARIQTTLYHFRSLRNVSGIEIRYHSTILYNSLFRSDNEMFITPHLYGLHGSKAPLLYVRRLSSDGVFTNFAQHFEAVWNTTHPIKE